MGKVELPGLCLKHGRLYFRRKVAGRDTYLRLPALDDPRFAEAYTRVSKPDTERKRPAKGTLAALVAAYRLSSSYTTIRADKTRENTARYLRLIEEEHGHRSVAGCRRSDVNRMRDVYAETPGKANNWLSVFRKLLAFAADNDWRRDNPAAGIKPLEIGEHEPWPAGVLERALDQASPMMRLAIITGLCSGARIGDCLKMQHGWHDGAIMQLRTGKNHADVAIPMHPLWLAELARMPRSSVTLLYDRTGKPFSEPKIVQERMRRLMEEIGSPTYLSNGKPRLYSFHGLRKNAACYLAELGLSDTEIGAICGMTPQTVRHYTKRARALTIARGAAEIVTRGDVIPLTGGREQKGTLKNGR